MTEYDVGPAVLPMASNTLFYGAYKVIAFYKITCGQRICEFN